jgi:hypothetical protein
MEVRMPLLRLIKDPKFLNFLKLKPGTDQTGVFRVERSDGQPVALEVIIPPSSRLAGNLEISPVLPNLWSVTAKSADLAPGTLLAEAIILRDSLSGMEDVLPVLLSTR